MWSFDDVIGNRKIIEHLQGAIRHNKMGHAYLFSGTDGIGKRMVANRLAATLQCEAGGTNPCGTCRSCMQIQNGNHPDVFYLKRTKGIIGVDDIREQIHSPMAIKPYSGPYKIFIVDEAEKMNSKAQNALLKTLEEPPAYGMILLLTSNPEAFLQTILSRVVHLPFLAAREADIMEFLMEKYQVPDYRGRLAAVLSGGSPGQAISIATSAELQEQRENVVMLMKSIPDGNPGRRAAQGKSLASKKAEVGAELDLMLLWIRDLMFYKAEGTKAKLMYPEETDSIAAQAGRITFEGLWEMTRELSELRSRLLANVNAETSFWILLSRWTEAFL